MTQGKTPGSKFSWIPVAFQAHEGVELLEFSLILPFLLVILAGVIDFGGAWTTKDNLAGAAREGARVATASFNDTTNPQCSGTPCSVQAAASAVTKIFRTKA